MSPYSQRTAPLAAAKGAVQRVSRDVADFVVRVYHKAGSDNIFFLAGGIAFNFLLAAVPFLLLLIAIFAYLPEPEKAAAAYVERILPNSQTIEVLVAGLVERVVTERGRFGVLGILLLIWVSTRVIGSLRGALRSVFDVREDRGIIAGKIFDAKMVIVAGTLFLANTAITIALEAVQQYGIELLGLSQSGEILMLNNIFAQLLAYGFIILMFVLIYRYLPARRIPWRIALVASIFTGVVFELLKSAFAWYVRNLGSISPYGTFATIVLLVFWIYYSAVVFVLGGEVGQVYELHRLRRRQRELLD